MAIKGFAAKQEKSKLEPFEYEPEALKPNEVEIEITHCGICYSDIHMIDNDWGMTSYPLLPGHEVIGVIKQKGEQVEQFEDDQRVGVGWQADSCMHCEWCVDAHENLCSESQGTIVGRHGGFANRIRVNSDFVFSIPSNLDSKTAAPLLCAGITVYSPLKKYGKPGGFNVGVIGIGGLGHLAIQFASAMGFTVTAFSSSPDKESEARDLGAHHFVNSKKEGQMKKAKGSIDLLLNTATAALDWSEFVKLLRPNGTLCFLGASGKLEMPLNMLLFGQKAVTASVIGNRANMMEMLDFASRHSIKTQTETMPMSKINEALDKVRNNKVRYRMVLIND